MFATNIYVNVNVEEAEEFLTKLNVKNGGMTSNAGVISLQPMKRQILYMQYPGQLSSLTRLSLQHKKMANRVKNTWCEWTPQKDCCMKNILICWVLWGKYFSKN